MKLAVIGDAHIGSYGRAFKPETGLNARLVDLGFTLRQTVKHAVENGCEAILFAGDMFKHARPTPTEIRMASMAFEVDVPVYAIPGNHDMPRAKGEFDALQPLKLMPNFRVFTMPEVVDMGDWQLATLPYPNRACVASIVDDYEGLDSEQIDSLITRYLIDVVKGLAAELDKSKPSILLGHVSLDISEAGAEREVMVGRDVTLPVHDIPDEFTFAAFGHIHKPQAYALYNKPNAFHVGSIDRIDFGEEGEQKSYVVIDTEQGGWRRVPIESREYKTFSLDMTKGIMKMEPDVKEAKDAIVRVKITRDFDTKPEYEKLQHEFVQAGCFDFRGFVEDVKTLNQVRVDNVLEVNSLLELIKLWHQTQGCKLPLGELLAAASTMEDEVKNGK